MIRCPKLNNKKNSLRWSSRGGFGPKYIFSIKTKSYGESLTNLTKLKEILVELITFDSIIDILKFMGHTGKDASGKNIGLFYHTVSSEKIV